MRTSKHTSKFAGSVKEHSRNKGPVANRYEHELYHDRVREKLSAEKAESSAVRSSKNSNVTSPGASHVSKGILREGGRLKAVRTTAVVASPLTTGTIVGAVAAGVYGAGNIIRYAKNEKSGIQATKDTVASSAGIGISSGIGVAAANAIAGTSLALGSTIIVPLVTGAVAAYVSMAVWDKLFYKGKYLSRTG